MKVYDCFMFYNEFELLELRLKSLWNVVDYFVLVEADRGHTNIPEPFYFNERKNEFKEYLPKIRHIMVTLDIPYKGTGDWTLENAHRNSIIHGLKDAEPDDLIFVSDLDEFPAPDIVQRITNRQTPITAQYITPPLANGNRIAVPCQLMIHAIDWLDLCPLAMNQNFHYYYFDWISKGTWQGTVLSKYKNLTTPQGVRNMRTFLPRIPNGGWHFSYMGGVERIVSKVTTIVDGNEMAQSDKRILDREHILNAMRNGTDIYGRKGIPESQFYHYDVNNIKLPYLNEFLKKYPQFLRATDPGLK